MNQFREIRLIGEGGFGVVHEVEDDSGKRFAKKTFRPQPSFGLSPSEAEKLKQRFKREVITQRELGGTEILRVLHDDLNASAPWFVMPLAEKSYDTKIAEDRASNKVDPNALADILNGLQFLHESGFVHRDLNPKNILLHDGSWKLSDFGAVLPPSGRTVTLTEDTVIYTEVYCSPEQRNDFHAATSAADVYAFGCILHDLFGASPRVPYAQQTGPGAVGMIIEKCTELNPDRRPQISKIRGMLFDALFENDHKCGVTDSKSEEWIGRLESFDSWDANTFDEFVRFFAQLDVNERTAGNENSYVYSLSTPFLTRMPGSLLAGIAEKTDGRAYKIIEKYCDWAGSTSFMFYYSDMVCLNLVSIFQRGTMSAKARAFVALIKLAASHNRWFIMRQSLELVGTEIDKQLARKLSIEVQTENAENQLCYCCNTVGWERELLHPDILKLCL